MDVRMPRHGRPRGDPHGSCADPACRGTRVLVLTTFDDDELRARGAARRAPAASCSRTPGPTSCSRRSRSSRRATRCCAPGVTRRLIERFADAAARRRRATPGTGRPDRAASARCCAPSPRACPTRRSPTQLHIGLRHGEDPRQPPADQAGLPGPGPAGDVRLRVGAHQAAGAGLTVHRRLCAHARHPARAEPLPGDRGWPAARSRPGEGRPGVDAHMPGTTRWGRPNPSSVPEVPMSRSSALREVTTYLVIAYSLAVGIALALPHAGINRVAQRARAGGDRGHRHVHRHTPGHRRDAVAFLGLGAPAVGSWPAALVVPMCCSPWPTDVALLLGVAHPRTRTCHAPASPPTAPTSPSAS